MGLQIEAATGALDLETIQNRFEPIWYWHLQDISNHAWYDWNCLDKPHFCRPNPIADIQHRLEGCGFFNILKYEPFSLIRKNMFCCTAEKQNYFESRNQNKCSKTITKSCSYLLFLSWLNRIGHVTNRSTILGREEYNLAIRIEFWYGIYPNI